MFGTVLLLLLEIILLVIGQILWKTGVGKIGSIQLDNVLLLLTSYYFWAGVMIYGVATVLWIIILSRANLSTVYPMQSLAYIFGVTAGIFVFGEHVSVVGWIGLLLIMSGVVLTGTGLK